MRYIIFLKTNSNFFEWWMCKFLCTLSFLTAPLSWNINPTTLKNPLKRFLFRLKWFKDNFSIAWSCRANTCGLQLSPSWQKIVKGTCSPNQRNTVVFWISIWQFIFHSVLKFKFLVVAKHLNSFYISSYSFRQLMQQHRSYIYSGLHIA